MAFDDFFALNERITACEECPRLRSWCRTVAHEKRKSFSDQTYWGRPVPNFGDPAATGLIVGLAPAAHGANRTGRMFTGDRSGDWLYSVLHEAGVASQPTAVSATDGLRLQNVLITAVCHCAPPDNKPLPAEMSNCEQHLTSTFHLNTYRAFLCLGSIAWRATLSQLALPRSTKFAHGARLELPDGRVVLGSYHPSQQNTFTGRLTRPMLVEVVQEFVSYLR